MLTPVEFIVAATRRRVIVYPPEFRYIITFKQVSPVACYKGATGVPCTCYDPSGRLLQISYCAVRCPLRRPRQWCPACRFVLFLLHWLVLNVLNALRHQRSFQKTLCGIDIRLKRCSTPLGIKDQFRVSTSIGSLYWSPCSTPLGIKDQFR